MKLVCILVLVVIYALGILGYVGGVLVIGILGTGALLLDLLNPYVEKRRKNEEKQLYLHKKRSDARKKLAKRKNRIK